MKATEVTAGLAEGNGSLLPGPLRDSLHVTCSLTACTPGSAPGRTLGNEYGKTFWSNAFYLFYWLTGIHLENVHYTVYVVYMYVQSVEFPERQPKLRDAVPSWEDDGSDVDSTTGC